MKLSLNPNTYLQAEGKELFLFGLRWSFGFWLLYVGAMKWINGPAGFIGYIGKDFANAWPPEIMITVLGWIIVVAEPLLGLLLIIGWRPRLVWLATAKLMWILMFGKTIVQDYPTVANNWQYFVLALAACCLTPPEKSSE